MDSRLQPQIKPLHRLVEGLLLRELHLLIGQVASHREAMTHAGVKVDLPTNVDF